MKLMKREDSSGIEGLAWLAIGALVGVTAAMLFAPDKGSNTRRRLAGQVEVGRENLFHSTQEAILRGRELYERGREIAQEAADLFEQGRNIAEPGLPEPFAEGSPVKQSA